jgi:glycerophosphoryl diester phosphodiesterase
VLAWPVDSEDALARAERLGVTGVISKDLPMLTRLVGRRDSRTGTTLAG